MTPDSPEKFYALLYRDLVKVEEFCLPHVIEICTARPRGTLPHDTLTSMGHCFEMGPKIL